MSKSEFQSDQLVNNNALAVTRQAAGSDGDALLNAIDKNFDSPMRLFASNPSDAKLNFQAQQFQAADGSGKSIPPIKSTIPAVTSSTVNLQTQATTGATFAITFPTTDTVGNFIRIGFTLLSSGVIQAVFSASNASLSSLVNPGTLFISGGVPLGWIDLQCTAGTGTVAYKTAGSTTSIIENSVGGVSRVVNFGSGGGGSSGTGNADEYQQRLARQLEDSNYGFCDDNIFEVNANAHVTAGSTTASYDIATQTYKFTGSQIFVSDNCLDPEFLTLGQDLAQIELTVFWLLAGIDTAATYAVSRDGGNNYFPVTMSRIGLSDSYRGVVYIQTAESTFATLSTQAATTTAAPLNLTTAVGLAAPFTLTGESAATSLTVGITKVGSPLGTFALQLVKDNGSGSPSLLAQDVVCQTARQQISTLTSGTQQVTLSAPTTLLLATTYHLVLVTDSTYQASFVTGTTQIAWNTNTSGTTVGKTYSGTAWSALAVFPQYTVTGRVLDLRVKITSSVTSTL